MVRHLCFSWKKSAKVRIGGASVLTKLKSDEIMCQSNTTYAESKEYIFTGTRTGPDKPAVSSRLPNCVCPIPSDS